SSDVCSSDLLVVISGGRAGHTHRHAARLLREALMRVGSAAAEHGLHVAVQPMPIQHSSKWSFLKSIDATLEVLERCKNPYVGLAFDVYQLWREVELCRRMDAIAPWVHV